MAHRCCNGALRELLKLVSGCLAFVGVFCFFFGGANEFCPCKGLKVEGLREKFFGGKISLSSRPMHFLIPTQ